MHTHFVCGTRYGTRPQIFDLPPDDVRRYSNKASIISYSTFELKKNNLGTGDLCAPYVSYSRY